MGKRGEKITSPIPEAASRTVTLWPARQIKVRVQKDSSDTRFTPKMAIFKHTILNTPYIKTLEIFLSARESLPVQTSASRSVRNEFWLQCS